MNNYIEKFIITSITDYFDSFGLNESKRYYFRVDTNEQLNGLIEYLEGDEKLCKKEIIHSQIKDNYSTYFYDKSKVFFAISYSNGITKYFLANLRNIIGEGEYKEYSLVMIFQGELDTITRGTKSLTDAQLPLNIEKVMKSLDKSIEANMKSS